VGVFGTIEAAREAVESVGGEAYPIKTDLTKEADMFEAVRKTMQRYKRLDILVNNASAIWTYGTADTDTRHFDYVSRVCQVRGEPPGGGASLARRAQEALQATGAAAP
jgi:NAD(P)-dependent dehydrogenase (short-subunit alcohol dehydrogenase family)